MDNKTKVKNRRLLCEMFEDSRFVEFASHKQAYVILKLMNSGDEETANRIVAMINKKVPGFRQWPIDSHYYM